MTELSVLEEALAGARVEAEVFALRPDYRAVLLAVDGLVRGPSDEAGEELLQEAEVAAHQALQTLPVEQLSHVAAWREACRAFGSSRSARATASRPCCGGQAPAGCPG